MGAGREHSTTITGSCRKASEVSRMRMTSTLAIVVMLICMTAAGTMAEFAGPRLDGTVTLRSGQTISGTVLTAQLGIVDGAEIGSRLRDGGYIAVSVNGQEQRIQATEIAAVDVEWSQTGTPEDPKWKITGLQVTTRAGDTVAGTPAWLVHATSLIVQEEDGTQKKVYAFPMAGSNFSPDNLLASLILDPTVAPAIPAPATPTVEPLVPAPTEPVTEPADPVSPLDAPAEPVIPAEPVTPAEPVAPVEQPAVEQPADPVVETPQPVVPEPEAPAAPETVLSVTALPTVEQVPEGSVFASGQPAVVTFEIINPETGNPMSVRFLIVPLPAQ